MITCESCKIEIPIPQEWEEDLNLCEKCIWEQYGAEIKGIHQEMQCNKIGENK